MVFIEELDGLDNRFGVRALMEEFLPLECGIVKTRGLDERLLSEKCINRVVGLRVVRLLVVVWMVGIAHAVHCTADPAGAPSMICPSRTSRSIRAERSSTPEGLP